MSETATAEPTTTEVTAEDLPTTPVELPEELKVPRKVKHPKGSYVGRMAVDSNGAIGVITGRKRGSWTGYNWLTGEPWSAKHARAVTDDQAQNLLIMKARAIEADALEAQLIEARRSTFLQRVVRVFRP